MIAAKTKYFKIKNPETGEFDSFIFIKGDKGYVIGPDQITSVLGESEELVASQSLANEIQHQVDNNKADIIFLYKQVCGDENDNQTLFARLGSLEEIVNAHDIDIYETEGHFSTMLHGLEGRVDEKILVLKSRLEALEAKHT